MNRTPRHHVSARYVHRNHIASASVADGSSVMPNAYLEAHTKCEIQQRIHMRTRPRCAQRGAAIIMAMSVVAIATVAAAAMLSVQNVWSRQTEMMANHAQALVMVAAATEWSRSILSDDKRISVVDNLSEIWALRLPPVPVEGGTISGHIEDQQGLFNLNKLVRNGKPDAQQLDCLLRLLSTTQSPSALADTLAAGMQARQLPSVNNNGTTISNTTDYATLTDLTELSAIPGFGTTVRARLQPFITVLPRPTSVNVNTAPAEVLAAVIKGLELGAAQLLVANRERAPFRDTADFLERLPLGATPIADVAVSSDYFIVNVTASISSAQASGTTLLARSSVQWPTIVWQKLL